MPLKPCQRTGLRRSAVAVVVLCVAALGLSMVGCRSEDPERSDATCTSAMASMYNASCPLGDGEGNEVTQQEAVDSCETWQAEVDVDCGVEFEAWLSCEAGSSSTDCANRCIDSWNDLLECDDPCGACLADNCSTEDAACGGNPVCLDLIDCIVACPEDDETCVEDCAAAHEAGVADLNAYLECLNSQCSVECG